MSDDFKGIETQWRNSHELYPVRAGGTQANRLPGGAPWTELSGGLVHLRLYVHKYSGKHFTVYVKNNFCMVLFLHSCGFFVVYFAIYLYFPFKIPLKFASKRPAKCSYCKSFMVLQKDLGYPCLGAPNFGRTRGRLVQTYAPVETAPCCHAVPEIYSQHIKLQWTLA